MQAIDFIGASFRYFCGETREKVGFLTNAGLTKACYEHSMIEDVANAGRALEPAGESARLEAMLAQGDAVLGTIAPILRHLLAHDDHSMFSDEIVARVRGMAADVARQLLDALDGEELRAPMDDPATDELAQLLTGSSPFLCHVHALALEWQLTERLQVQLALDPVLSPLLQALVGSSEPATSGIAMNLLAAQARFCQAQRRMQLPLGELPGDLLHGALLALRTHAATDDTRAEAAEKAIRSDYDEGHGRLGLISRLVTGMGGGMIAALTVEHAGAAIFLSALATASGQDRDTAVLATSEGQGARLALALRAAGLKPQAVEEQFLTLNPHATLPRGIDRFGAHRAAEILSLSGGHGPA